MNLFRRPDETPPPRLLEEEILVQIVGGLSVPVVISPDHPSRHLATPSPAIAPLTTPTEVADRH